MEQQREEQKGIGEEIVAYESLHKFELLCQVNREVFQLEDFSELIYKIYPTFFLRGIVFNGTRYILDGKGEVSIAPTLARHHPKKYMYYRLSMLVRKIMKQNSWEIIPEQVAYITEKCEKDFEGEFLDFFPYTIRVFTKNEVKKVNYLDIFPKAKFEVFEFEEIQADVDDVTRSKLDQIEDGETSTMDVVDDVGMELYAMDGAPGPYVKYFMETLKPVGIEKLCVKNDERRVLIHQSVAVSYWMHGTRQRIMYHAYFPCKWRLVPGRAGYGYDPYVEYEGCPLAYLQKESRFVTIMMGWVWHRFKRRRLGLT